MPLGIEILSTFGSSAWGVGRWALGVGSLSLIIAIDGPSGAGKGTVARGVAARLGYTHIDTGAMYRAVAWKVLHDGVDLNDERTVSQLARSSRIVVRNGMVHIDGKDVATAIRTPEIDAAAAAVARQPRVREVLVAEQRRLSGSGNIVMEGRDIGTVVFPDADVKVYLDADPEERAKRRARDPAHTASRTGAALHDVGTAITTRDLSDMTRAASPLVQAPDAVKIDTTRLSVDEVIEKVLELVESKRR